MMRRSGEDIVYSGRQLRSLIGPAILAIPIILLLLWHLSNNGLPTDDAANYAETSLQIFREFENGPVAGVVAMFNIRGWRPTIFSTLCVPYLLLTGGDVVVSCAATLLSIYAALTFYLYRLAALFTADRLIAAVSSAAVLSMPVILSYSIVFFSESAWVLFAVAFVYHLFRSDHLQDSWHSFAAGLYGALMGAVRPAESLLILIVFLAFLLVPAGRARKVAMGPIFTVIAIFSVPAFLLVLSAWVQDLTRFHIWSASFGAGLVAWILKARLNRAHVAFFGTLVSLASLWWAGFMPGLLAWAREGAEYVRVARSGAIYSARETLFRQVLDYGELQLAVLAALGILLLSSSMLGGRARKSPSGTSGCRPLDVLLYPAGATLSLFVALYAGAGSDRRRSLVAITLFSCALFVGAANRFRVAIAAVLCLTAVQYIVIGSAIAGAPRWAAANAFGIPIPHRSPDDNIETAKMLAKHVPQGSVVAVYTLALFSPSDRVYEPNAMRVASLEGEFGFGVGYYWDMAIYDKTISRMQQEGIDYLLLDSFSALPPDASHEPYAHFIKDLLGRVQASSDTPGLQVVAGLHLGNREHFLFRISPLRTQDADSLTVERKGARAIASEEQAGFPVGNINDGTDKAWGSLEGRTDVFAGVVLPVPGAVRAVRLRLMTPNGRAHLRNIRIVTADREKPDAPDWQFVRARLQGERDFVDVITIPPLGDNSTIVIEVDEKDPRWKAHLVWGIACLRSKGDVPNYVPDGTGVYFRELELQ